MLPVFGDERRRREINLGGSVSSSSQTAIVERAKARRMEREALRKREESALKIQSWWKGNLKTRRVRQRMRQLFLEDPTSLTGLRCLVFVGRDEDLLRRWSEVVSKNDQILLDALTSQEKEHWLTLLCRVSVLLIRSVANAPSSPAALTHLRVLCTLLDPQSTITTLSDSGLSRIVSQYIMQRGLFENVHRAISAIALQSKHDPPLRCLVKLIYLPFSNIDSSSGLLAQYLRAMMIHIMTIPLLPNCIPRTSLSELSAHFPCVYLDTLSPYISDIVAQTSTSAHINILTNLFNFIPPIRYATLPPSSLAVYIQFITALFSALPLHVLGSLPSEAGSTSWDEESDTEEDRPPESGAVVLDAKAQKKLEMFPSHLMTLLKITHQHRRLLPDMVIFLVSLNIAWPTMKDKVLGALLLYGGGGLVREIFREQVRVTPLGRTDNMVTLMDPKFQPWWPPLILFTDLYTHTLRTMGDDEFFSSSSMFLTLNDLIPFSRALFNIAFTLYWREDQSTLESHVPGLNLRWISVREKITRCLVAIHARDSRRPFLPENHWQLGTQIDMSSFIDAAIYEEQQININDNVPDMPPHSKRRLPHLSRFSPRLSVLHSIPFAIPFETRVHIFREFIHNDKGKHGVHFFSHIEREHVSIRRGHIAQDGYDKLSGINIRTPIFITFIDQFGEPEAGIDGGGVFKEFFTSLCKEVFDTDRGLWLETKKNEIYPNPHSYASEVHQLSWYRFIGRILGKALYEGILVDVAFAGFFLAKWLGKQSFLDDLASLDPELYNGLIYLKNCVEDAKVDELSLNFTIATEEFGVTKAKDLIFNGSNIPVTRENRLKYIHLVSHYKLTQQIKSQSDAFFDGMSGMIDNRWLRMFNQQELQMLLSGVNSPIDMEDLRQHTQYGGVYNDGDPTIQAFWKVLDGFNQEQGQAFLRFVTSCSRPPLLGFKQLNPNFAIREAGSDQNRLPSASTCVNLLKLPRYTNERVLRAKLLQAISSGAGFDLS